MEIDEYSGMCLNPSGGGGGGGSDAHVTTTTTNPVVPDDLQALSNSMGSIATGLQGAPVNFGPIPGLDAPRGGPLIPQPSMGNLFSSAPFLNGFNRLNVMGQGRSPSTLRHAQPFRGGSMGSMFAGGGPMRKPTGITNGNMAATNMG